MSNLNVLARVTNHKTRQKIGAKSKEFESAKEGRKKRLSLLLTLGAIR